LRGPAPARGIAVPLTAVSISVPQAERLGGRHVQAGGGEPSALLRDAHHSAKTDVLPIHNRQVVVLRPENCAVDQAEAALPVLSHMEKPPASRDQPRVEKELLT
jgi:hypothetical protein